VTVSDQKGQEDKGDQKGIGKGGPPIVHRGNFAKIGFLPGKATEKEKRNAQNPAVGGGGGGGGGDISVDWGQATNRGGEER